MDSEEGEPMYWLPKYIPPCKGITKVPKDPDNAKFMISIPLLLKKVVSEGMLLGHILSLTMEDCDLGDHKKFPWLASKKYLAKNYFEETRVTRLEPMKWVMGV